MPSNPVLEHIKSKAEKPVKTLSSGIRVIIHGVSNFEMQELAMTIPDPIPPRIKDEDTGREFENLDDPLYQKQVTDMNIKRGLLSLDSMLLGVELVDGMPEDDKWIQILKFKAKRGIIDLSSLDFDNPIEKEFAYKKYVAFLNTDDWKILQNKVEEGQEAANKADAMFPSNEERSADSPTPPEATGEGQTEWN